MDSSGDDADDTAAAVSEVDCAMATPAMTITTTGNAYTPNQATIAPGGVIKWAMPAEHDVASSTAGFIVGFGGTKCLKFSTAGSYDYRCSAHGFTGTVLVQ